MLLSEDDIKIIINVLNQSSYKLPDAQIILGIVNKLQKMVMEPNLKPAPVEVSPIEVTDVTEPKP